MIDLCRNRSPAPDRPRIPPPPAGESLIAARAVRTRLAVLTISVAKNSVLAR
nr:hypothetical protein GCM10010200_107740 [Actinomadura rugatobispora]